MATKWSAKDPNDIADYWFDWTDFLPELETITDATITIPAEVDQPIPEAPYDYLEIVSQSFADKRVRVRLSGGIATVGYLINCLITTSDDQVFEDTKTLWIKERIKF